MYVNSSLAVLRNSVLVLVTITLLAPGEHKKEESLVYGLVFQASFRLISMLDPILVIPSVKSVKLN